MPAPMTVLTRTQIAVAVVIRAGHVLVGRRDPGAADAAGLCEFPGGKVDPGERPESAAARECLEEAGMRIRIGRRLDAVRAESSRGPVDVLFFIAEPIAADEPPHVPFAWRPVSSLGALSFPAANAGVINWLERHHGGS
jgi:8-oxo-dGTP diphosphatase